MIQTETTAALGTSLPLLTKAQHRLAAEAKAARRARRDQMRDQTVAEPRLRGLRRVWRLLPLPA